jgi:hypothetical protein
MNKPNAAAVRASAPLSIVPLTADRMACCNVCGKPSDVLEVWRAHDERDNPIAGDRALVFLGAGDAHEPCHVKLEEHPRLFAQVRGHVGHLPRLCGPCVHRRGLSCSHPEEKGNGGAGLRFRLDGMTGVICYGRKRGGCVPLDTRQAVECTGRTVKEAERLQA